MTPRPIYGMKNTVLLKEFGALSFDTAQIEQASAPAIPEPLPPLGNKGLTKSKATMQRIKRIVIAVVGGTVLALGIVLIVLPGGLAILAIEFAWARRWLRSARAILSLRAKDDPSPHRSPPP